MVINFFLQVLLMFVSPVLSLWNGMVKYGHRYKRWLLTAFITFYGSVIFLSEAADGYRHRQAVVDHYLDMDLSTFFLGLYHIIVFNPLPITDDDVYLHLISFFVGSVLETPQLFFIVVSFVYGYFFSGSILGILKYVENWKEKKLVIAFAGVLILWQSLEGINTVRTWTGMWVLFYSSLRWLETRNKKYIVLMFFPPLVHVGYFVMALPAWLFLLVGNWPRVFIFVFALSFLVDLISPSTALEQIERTELGATKFKGYYSDSPGDGPSEIKTNQAWYYVLYKAGYYKWAIHAIIFSVALFGYYFRNMNNLETSLFSMGVLMMTLSNASWFLFAVANRSGIIGGVFILASLVLFFSRAYNSAIKPAFWIRHYWWLVFFSFIPVLIVKLSHFVYFLSVFLFIFPFVPWIYSEWNMSIRDFIRMMTGI